MKILVTGANGYLGLGIVKQLLDDGNEVIATDVVVDLCDKRATCVACNIFDVEDPYSFFGEPDVVLHLAWRDGFVHNADSHIENIPLHHMFLRKFFGSKVKRIAVMGSMHEVGFFEGSIDENSKCNPMSLYGIAKNTLRQVVEYMGSANGKPFQWLRGYYIVGNTSYGSSIFSKIAKMAEEAEKESVEKEFPFTMGLNQFDFIDYEEFCMQVATTVEQGEVLGIINICQGRPETLANRVERFIKENGFRIKLKYGAFPDRPYDSKAVWGNNQKINMIMSKRNGERKCQ